LLPLAKVAPVFALGFVISAVVDDLSVFVPLYMVGYTMRDAGDA
jgi:zinc transporter ZupT